MRLRWKNKLNQFKYEKVKHPRYKFRMIAPYTYTLSFNHGIEYAEYEYFIIHDQNKITLKIDYYWNGCTKGIDFKRTIRASPLHDLLAGCNGKDWRDQICRISVA